MGISEMKKNKTMDIQELQQETQDALVDQIINSLRAEPTKWTARKDSSVYLISKWKNCDVVRNNSKDIGIIFDEAFFGTYIYIKPGIKYSYDIYNYNSIKINRRNRNRLSRAVKQWKKEKVIREKNGQIKAEIEICVDGLKLFDKK